MGTEENFTIGDEIAMPELARHLNCGLEEVDFSGCDAQHPGKLGFISTHKTSGRSFYVTVVLDSTETLIKEFE